MKYFITIIFIASTCLALTLTAAGASSDLVHTPIGPMSAACVHHVPSGSEVEVVDGGFRAVYPDASVHFLRTPDDVDCTTSSKSDSNSRDANGWQAWTTFNDQNKTFTGMSCAFTVPSKPKNFGGGVIFIFPGLQNFDWIPEHAPPFSPPAEFDIIQPVIQYGASAAGETKGWGLASWYVTTDGGTVVSDLFDVDFGEVINSTMYKLDDKSKWLIKGVAMNHEKVAQITVDKTRLTEQPWAYVTLEVYGINGCDSYPEDTSDFTNIVLVEESGVQADWVVHKGDTVLSNCPGSAVVKSPREVILGFGN